MNNLKKILFSFVLGFSLCLVGFNGQSQGTACEGLVWSDEFDYDGAPADDKWDYDTGGGGWGNEELQNYTNNRTNSWVENGKLYIKAVKAGGNWTSARLITKEKGDWLYGRIEVKAKLPTGKGTWPAIWMLPTDWEYGDWPASGEIDIMEHVGYDLNVIHGTVHTQAYHHSIGTQKGGKKTITNATTDFNVYTIEWNEDKIEWYINDEWYFTFSNENKTYEEWPFDKQFHLLLNIAIGGTWGGAEGIDPDLTEATMEVEYVRVYKDKIPKPRISGPTSSSKDEQLNFQVNPVEGVQYLWQFPEGVFVLSGEGTNSVNVQWHDQSGDIQLEMRNQCDTAVSDVFHVDYILKPESDRFDIDAKNSTGTIMWSKVPGENNSFTISEENQELVVDFDVSNPSGNPYIHYDFDGIIDLTDHNELAFELKIDPDNAPSNMRIDLIDVNGNVKITDLFKIDDFESDSDFHFYSHQFSTVNDGTYLLDQISQVRIYVNYGVFGKNGSGKFRIKNMRAQDPNATSSYERELTSGLRIFPNPATELMTVHSDESISFLELYSATGQLVFSMPVDKKKQMSVSVNELKKGLYFLKINQNKTKKVLIQ